MPMGFEPIETIIEKNASWDLNCHLVWDQ